MDSGIVAECAPGDFSAGASSGIVACDGPGDFFQPFFLSAFFLLRDFGLGGGSSADFFDCFGFDAFLGGDGGCLGSVSILYASWIFGARGRASAKTRSGRREDTDLDEALRSVVLVVEVPIGMPFERLLRV